MSYLSLCSDVIFGRTFSRFSIALSVSKLWDKLTQNKNILISICLVIILK